jgi:methylase of polypeptide subunit release factors
LEIGSPQETAVRKLVEDRGEYEMLPTIKDFAGHPRVVSARKR